MFLQTWSNEYIQSPGASSGIWIDRFEVFLQDWELPNFSAIQFENMSFYWISSNIDGFENLSLKIDGFGRTHADEASGIYHLA